MSKTKTNKPKKQPKKQSKSTLAAKLNVSRSTLHDWQKQGCPIDDGDKAILAWALKSGRRGFESDAIRAARLAVLNETAKRLRLANQVKEGLILDRNDVQFAMGRTMSLLFSTLDRYATATWPPTLRGLSESEISTKVLADVEKLKDEFRAGLQNLMAGEEEKSKP
jgi:hypothetical protein